MADGQDLSDPGVYGMTPEAASAALAEIGRAHNNQPAPPAAVSDHIATTPAQAAARLAQLQADPKWVDKFLAGSGAQQREFAELSALALTGDGGDQPDALIEVVDSISDKNAL